MAILFAGMLQLYNTAPTWLPIQGDIHDGSMLNWLNTEQVDGTMVLIFTQLPPLYLSLIHI